MIDRTSNRRQNASPVAVRTTDLFSKYPGTASTMQRLCLRSQCLTIGTYARAYPIVVIPCSISFITCEH